MSLVVYAITDAPAANSGSVRTVEHGDSLRTVEHGGLAAVVSEHDGASADRSEVFDYERVMERLMAERTILPMRFGSVLADEREVRAVLSDRAEELHAGLERVRGAVELSLRAGWREPPERITAAGPGTAYMLDRVALERRARALADRLDPLGALARDMRRRIARDDDLPVRDAYLVDRGRVTAFTDSIKQLDERHGDIELVCTGPWPPYSFASEGPE
jgi:hypothetical protein